MGFNNLLNSNLSLKMHAKLSKELPHPKIRRVGDTCMIVQSGMSKAMFKSFLRNTNEYYACMYVSET